MKIWYRFVSPDEIEAELAKWLTRYNRVSEKTSLAETAALYRDFILIHPFINGNGRTARVLTDGALLKAGFPSLHHHAKAVRSVLFYTDQEIVAKFLKSYE